MSISLKRRASPSYNKDRMQPLVYTEYRMSYREYAMYILQGLGIVILFAYFFYHSYVAVIFLMPYILYFVHGKKRKLCDERKQELCFQFKEMITSLSTCLYAGYSIENAFHEVYGDMLFLYGKEAMICKEMRYILTSLDHNTTLERLLTDLGERSGVDDIREFGEIFAIARRSSGDIKKIMQCSASVIGEKIEVKRDIHTVMSAKIFEQKIMRIVPFGIMFYISITSKGFFQPLYHNATGVLLMTGCLLIYLLSNYLSAKIVEIRI